jgi:protein transport protein SEC61 subunit gamma-like protein
LTIIESYIPSASTSLSSSFPYFSPAVMVKKAVSDEPSVDPNIPQNSFQAALDPAKRFAQDSFRLVKRCTKPDAKEFKKIALATTVGFLVMGFLGFFVKLVHIPSQCTIAEQSCRHADTQHACAPALHQIGPSAASLSSAVCSLASCSPDVFLFPVNNIIVGQ